MSEKLKTFIIDEDGNFIINQNGKIVLLSRSENFFVLFGIRSAIYLKRNDIIKLFNLDLEVEDES